MATAENRRSVAKGASPDREARAQAASARAVQAGWGARAVAADGVGVEWAARLSGQPISGTRASPHSPTTR